MAKENTTLSLYRANRDRVRKSADAALAKAVASVAKKAGGKTGTAPADCPLPTATATADSPLPTDGDPAK